MVLLLLLPAPVSVVVLAGVVATAVVEGELPAPPGGAPFGVCGGVRTTAVAAAPPPSVGSPLLTTPAAGTGPSRGEDVAAAAPVKAAPATAVRSFPAATAAAVVAEEASALALLEPRSPCSRRMSVPSVLGGSVVSCRRVRLDRYG